MPSEPSRHVRSILPRRDPTSRAQVDLSLGDRCLWRPRRGQTGQSDDAASGAAISTPGHTGAKGGEHAARAGQWLAAETVAGHASGTGSGGSPRSVVSVMFLRLARADESGIAEPSRMRHVCENLHRAGLMPGVKRNDSVGPGPNLPVQCRRGHNRVRSSFRNRDG
jgi:hypothetical protein